VNGESDTSFAARRGQQLATALSSAVRTAGYYETSNAVMQQTSNALLGLLRDSSAEIGSVSFGVHSHCVFVDKARVPTSVSSYERFNSLIHLFDEWRITTLTFAPGLSEDELLQTLMLLSRSRPVENEDLPTLLRARGLHHVYAENTVMGRGRETRASTPLLVYSAAMQLGLQLSQSTGAIDPTTIRRARHVTQSVVDEILRDPAALLTLTTIKDFDRYLILHSTNVAVLSAILGERLGLDKPTLGELCLAGFLHDAGKMGVDPDVLNKPGALDSKEWEQMRRHPVMAASALLGGARLTASLMRTVVVAFEHHLNHDLSGYPPTQLKHSVSLFGGIVSMADRFDALTTARVYRKVNLTPPEAVAAVVHGAGTHFDSVLVKLFVEVMGIYPAGTVVVLSSGEAGVVCRPPAVGTPLDRPQVRVIVGGEAGKVVDLRERVGVRYRRSVLGVLNPSNKGQIPAVDPAIFASIA
jgi:HD-GYP domain-containing protein (c-di-GMP phosphodiesterase class II)